LHDVVFTSYTEHSSNPELVRRLLSPLAAMRLEREMAGSHTARAAQPVNLAVERFIVYVPAQRPSGGFALLVFVPPWQDARLPQGWGRALDQYGAIFVSAAQSGNDENVMGRREPLALLAAQNIMQQYPVDPQRVYIAGFSGGSRIALRLALGYPDVFRGVILNAGSDPIADPQIPLPPRDLIFKFQTSTHVVYVTGDRDTPHTSDDLISIRSMHQWCVFNVDDYAQPRLGHEVAPPEALSRALGSLLKDAPPDLAKLEACRSRIEMELAARLQEVESLMAHGRHAEAAKLLNKVDGRFGGLAAPRSVDLAAKL